jgi:hypothetical protein
VIYQQAEEFLTADYANKYGSVRIRFEPQELATPTAWIAGNAKDKT